MVGTVSFDVVGTLFTLDAPRRVLDKHGAPSSTFDLWFSEALRDYFARSHSGAYTPLKEVLENTLERAALAVSWEFDHKAGRELMESLRELTPAEGAEAGLDRLNQAGWKKIAVTNSSRELADTLLTRNGLAKYFETVISCDDLGMSKPHPRVYDEVKKHSSGESWLVAAHAWDVGGAITAGMRAIWLSAKERIYPDFLPAPEMTAADLGSACGSLVATGS